MTKDYFKDEAKTIIALNHQTSDANKKISEIDSILLQIESEQNNSSKSLDMMISEMENILANQEVSIENEDLEKEVSFIESELDNVNVKVDAVELLDVVQYSNDMPWNDYLTHVETYAERNDIDLELEFQKMFAFENIDLVQINKGIEPSIICIDGFMTENDNGNAWLINMPSELKKHSIYYLKWESQSFLKMVQEVFFPSLEKLFRKILAPLIVKDILKVWSTATSNAENAGKSLAGLLHNQEKDFILFGHSLGSRVICYCLENLNKSHKCNIVDVLLLGGAVGNNNSLWNKNHEVVNGTIYNFLSKRDKVLQILYKIGQGSKLDFESPVGRDPISVDFIQDINVTHIIKSHTVYHDKFRDLYQEYLSLKLSNKE